MRSVRCVFVWGSCVVLLVAIGLGCATSGGEDVQLTDAEKSAIQASAKSASAMSQAVGTTQSAVTADLTGTGKAAARAVTVGTCPQVTTTVTNLVTLTFDASIDFGESCTPVGTEDLTCSGSASGSFSQAAKSINMTFNDISCTDETLGGSVDLTYGVSLTAVTLTGDWDVTWTTGDEVFTVDGTGTCGYDLSGSVTSVSSYDGTSSGPDGSWATTMTDILISYTKGSYIPYSGTMTVSGSDIRTMTVRFNEDSPTTGKVEVKVGPSPFVTVDLHVLLDIE